MWSWSRSFTNHSVSPRRKPGSMGGCGKREGFCTRRREDAKEEEFTQRRRDAEKERILALRAEEAATRQQYGIP